MMTTSPKTHPASTVLLIERVGSAVIRYGLALILVWMGALKSASYEAAAIEGLVANSPFLSWTCRLASVREEASAVRIPGARGET
jgi:uncharacterized membrane protein YkgB